MDDDYFKTRSLSDGRRIGLGNLLFTTGLYVDIDEIGYSHRYCYPSSVDALLAFQNWDGAGHPPGNWLVRKGLGGDLRNPALEQSGDSTVRGIRVRASEAKS